MSTALASGLSVERLRSDLREQWKAVRPDTKLDITYKGDVVGVWTSVQTVRGLPIQRSESASIGDFRINLTRYWMELQQDLDCVLVTFHGQAVAALVSPRLLNT